MDDRPGHVSDLWPTLTEAASRTGHTREALRQRVRRGKLRAVKGNDGIVRLDARDLADLPALDATTDDQAAESGSSLDVLVTTLADLRTDLDRTRSALDEALADRLVDRGRAEKAEAERAAATARTSVVEAELVATRQELERERQALLTELRRPAWRRLLGL